MFQVICPRSLSKERQSQTWIQRVHLEVCTLSHLLKRSWDFMSELQLRKGHPFSFAVRPLSSLSPLPLSFLLPLGLSNSCFGFLRFSFSATARNLTSLQPPAGDSTSVGRRLGLRGAPSRWPLAQGKSRTAWKVGGDPHVHGELPDLGKKTSSDPSQAHVSFTVTRKYARSSQTDWGKDRSEQCKLRARWLPANWGFPSLAFLYSVCIDRKISKLVH